jgi:hypothetical protein
MCKELPVIPVNKVVDPKRIIGQKWRAEEEERHKGLLTHKKLSLIITNFHLVRTHCGIRSRDQYAPPAIPLDLFDIATVDICLLKTRIFSVSSKK